MKSLTIFHVLMAVSMKTTVFFVRCYAAQSSA